MAEAIYNELSQIEGFAALTEETKELFKNACSQQNSDNKSIKFTTHQANNLFCDGALESPDFAKFLNFFN